MKKLISFILLIAITLSSVGVLAGDSQVLVHFGDTKYFLDTFNSTVSPITLTSYSDTKQNALPDVVLIPATVESFSSIKPVSSVKFFSCEKNTENVKAIIIENGIESVFQCEFFSFPNLKSVVIPESVKNMQLSSFLPSKLPTTTEALGLTNEDMKNFFIDTTDESGRTISKVAPKYAQYESAFFEHLKKINKEQEELRKQITFYVKKGSFAEEYLKSLNFIVKNYVSVKYNENEIFFDQPSFIVEGRTLVPLRAMFETLGASVDWDGATQTVTASKGNTKISLQINSTKMYVNNTVKTLDVPAQLINSRTMVPVRAISEAFGCNVVWDGASQTVLIK